MSNPPKVSYFKKQLEFKQSIIEYFLSLETLIMQRPYQRTFLQFFTPPIVFLVISPRQKNRQKIEYHVQ